MKKFRPVFLASAFFAVLILILSLAAPADYSRLAEQNKSAGFNPYLEKGLLVKRSDLESGPVKIDFAKIIAENQNVHEELLRMLGLLPNPNDRSEDKLFAEVIGPDLVSISNSQNFISELENYIYTGFEAGGYKYCQKQYPLPSNLELWGSLAQNNFTDSTGRRSAFLSASSTGELVLLQSNGAILRLNDNFNNLNPADNYRTDVILNTSSDVYQSLVNAGQSLSRAYFDSSSVSALKLEPEADGTYLLSLSNPATEKDFESKFIAIGKIIEDLHSSTYQLLAILPLDFSNQPEVDEICNNGLDDNNDGNIDCNDSACTTHPEFCSGTSSEYDCGNSADDDWDNSIDCSDTDCHDDPTCHNIPATEYENGSGNDNINYETGCTDSSCNYLSGPAVQDSNSPCDSGTTQYCSDGSACNCHPEGYECTCDCSGCNNIAALDSPIIYSPSYYQSISDCSGSLSVSGTHTGDIIEVFLDGISILRQEGSGDFSTSQSDLGSGYHNLIAVSSRYGQEMSARSEAIFYMDRYCSDSTINATNSGSAVAPTDTQAPESTPPNNTEEQTQNTPESTPEPSPTPEATSSPEIQYVCTDSDEGENLMKKGGVYILNTKQYEPGIIKMDSCADEHGVIEFSCESEYSSTWKVSVHACPANGCCIDGACFECSESKIDDCSNESRDCQQSAYEIHRYEKSINEAKAELENLKASSSNNPDDKDLQIAIKEAYIKTLEALLEQAKKLLSQREKRLIDCESTLDTSGSGGGSNLDFGDTSNLG